MIVVPKNVYGHGNPIDWNPKSTVNFLEIRNFWSIFGFQSIGFPYTFLGSAIIIEWCYVVDFRRSERWRPTDRWEDPWALHIILDCLLISRKQWLKNYHDPHESINIKYLGALSPKHNSEVCNWPGLDDEFAVGEVRVVPALLAHHDVLHTHRHGGRVARVTVVRLTPDYLLTMSSEDWSFQVEHYEVKFYEAT